jgi:gamma-glutamyl:cysteine ligase YbdK (ATP-grasp superfamily)
MGYGLELEYMIVERDSLSVRPIADQLLDAVEAASLPSGFGCSNELVLHLLEVKNVAPRAGFHGLGQQFQATTALIDERLRPFNARLMPGGMHPWMDPATETRLWPHRDAEIYAAYDRIFDCRSHGWANIQSAQLNLAFCGDEQFARLHAAVRLLLPILPALAASSPIAEGRVRDMADYRMECYRVHPSRLGSLIGRVIPDDAADRASYERDVLGPMYRDVAPFDPAGVLHAEWLNARGAIPRFDRSAIEVRVVDMQECPQADVAIAAMTAVVAQALYEERWSPLADQRAAPTGSLADILAACVRDAEQAIIDDADYLDLLGFPRSPCTARQLWRHLLESCADAPLLSGTSQAILGTILERGPLARRLLDATGPKPSGSKLRAVYENLCDCLATGRLFTGDRP